MSKGARKRVERVYQRWALIWIGTVVLRTTPYYANRNCSIRRHMARKDEGEEANNKESSTMAT